MVLVELVTRRSIAAFNGAVELCPFGQQLVEANSCPDRPGRTRP